MARIKLEMPEQFMGSFQVPVRITDINYGNHLGNDAFVSILHEARMQWLQQYGYTDLNIEGAGLIMSDLCVEFKSESFYGDTIVVQIGVGERSRVGFELYYRMSVSRDNTDLLLAHARTGMICYDYSAKKVVAIPEKLKEILQS